MPSITRDELFFILDDFTGASTQSIEGLKKLLDQIVFDRPNAIHEPRESQIKAKTILEARMSGDNIGGP